MNDRRFMRRACELAAAGIGRVSPNPAVGAVLVRDGRIIGEGYHERYGGAHAETNCIHDARRRGEDPRGAVMYCTLEPCSFRSPKKHNPPCTESVIEAGITRMVIAARDPNPAVAGCGVRALRDAGIQTSEGLMEEQVLRMNESYFVAAATSRPYVHLKWAQSINGRLARSGGGKTAISGPEALTHMHHIRSELDAILVGATTVELDNPALTVRIPKLTEVRRPLRVVLDPELRIPPSSRVLCDGEAPTLVFHGAKAEVLSIDANTDAEFVALESFTVEAVLSHLYDNGIRSVLVEGGPQTHRRFLDAGLWDRLTVYIGPTLLDGDVTAPEVPEGLNEMGLAARETDLLGDTIVVSGRNPKTHAALAGLTWKAARVPEREGCGLHQEEIYVHRFGA